MSRPELELDEVDMEELQFSYDELCDEVVELQQELKAAKIEASQIRLRLKTQAASSSVAAPKLPAVTAGESAPARDNRSRELENFIVWLAEHVSLDSATTLDVGLEVPVGARTVQLQSVVQWPLSFSAGRRLYLSAPVECRKELQEMLATAKASGKVGPEAVQTLAAFWDLAPGELHTLTQKDPEPVVLLAHKTSRQGILVATWPTAGAMDAYRALCSMDGEPFLVGERVDVEYDGRWYVGTLHSLTSTGKASVTCDADGPGVLTMAPCYRVRRHGAPRGRAVSDQGPMPFYAEPDASAVQARRRCQSEGDVP